MALLFFEHLSQQVLDSLAVDRETLRSVSKPKVSPSSALLWLQGTPEAA